LFFVHEHALQVRAGDDRVMQEQYRRLLFNTHNIRIVSAEAAVASSSRVLWEYEKARPVAFTSTDLAKVFVQDPGAIARNRLLFDRLDQVALSAEQSRRKLAEYAGQPREELDDPGTRMA
jgi:hypothetical protein